MGRVHPPRPGHSGISSPGGIEGVVVKNQGGSIGTYSTLNFLGVDVSASPGAGQADIYIPSASYASHWNTADGDTGNQSVTESVSRTTAHISTPNGGEGTPFKTGGWANTDQSASNTANAVFTTPGLVTGFGAGATVTSVIFDADGAIHTYTTPALTGNVTLNVSPFTVVVSSYQADDNKFQANLSVTCDIAGSFPNGGRYHCTVTMTCDDGVFPYTQTDLFLDSDPSNPSIVGVTMAENVAVTKTISGLTYYNTGSTFTTSITDMDALNENTTKATGSLVVSATNYGIASLSQSPFGNGAGNFGGWTSDNNQNNVSYSNGTLSINQASFRYSAAAAVVSGIVSDPWGGGASQSSANASILVDTFGASATNTFEPFDEESRRLQSNYITPWNSATTLIGGEAMVFGGQLQIGHSNWSAYSPAGNPDYSALAAPASYFRKLLDNSGDLVSFTMTFTGNFISNATTDLANSNLEIYIRRINSAGGSSGIGSNPLRLHGSDYNFATFDDGATIAGSYIREATSSGNSVNGTFGGFAATDGIYIEVKIINSSIKISSMEITFF